MGQSIVMSGPKWDFVPFVVVQNAEDTQRGYEECNKGQNPAKCCKSSPDKNGELCGELTKSFLKRYELCVHSHTAQETPTCGQDEERSWIKAKCCLLKDCC